MVFDNVKFKQFNATSIVTLFLLSAITFILLANVLLAFVGKSTLSLSTPFILLTLVASVMLPIGIITGDFGVKEWNFWVILFVVMLNLALFIWVLPHYVPNQFSVFTDNAEMFMSSLLP